MLTFIILTRLSPGAARSVRWVDVALGGSVTSSWSDTKKDCLRFGLLSPGWSKPNGSSPQVQVGLEQFAAVCGEREASSTNRHHGSGQIVLVGEADR